MSKLLALLFVVSSVITFSLPAQIQTFTRDDIEYVLELPSPEWVAVTRLDVHDHVEFVHNNDSSSGYLRLKLNRVKSGTTGADLFAYDERYKLRSLPGYVACSECQGQNFSGKLNGLVFAYEYVSNGKTMAGRIYYLQVDSRTFYTLHFTAEREKSRALLSQMDSIARSFRMK